jgi:hypothetical protein
MRLILNKNCYFTLLEIKNMTDEKKITVREYAKNENISLEEVLEELKSLGFSGKADSVFYKKYQTPLKELRHKGLIYAKTKTDEQLENIKRTYQIIELCLALLPDKYRIPIYDAINFKVYIEDLYSYLKKIYYREITHSYTKIETPKIEIPKWIIN